MLLLKLDNPSKPVDIGNYVFKAFPWVTYTAEKMPDGNVRLLAFLAFPIRFKQIEFDFLLAIGSIDRV